jgi:hypothetical protein
MVRIINGLNEIEFARRIKGNRAIVFELENYATQQLILCNVEKKDGSTHIFTFTTPGGASGFYDSRSQKGEINYPSTTTTMSETTPKIGA